MTPFFWVAGYLAVGINVVAAYANDRRITAKDVYLIELFWPLVLLALASFWVLNEI